MSKHDNVTGVLAKLAGLQWPDAQTRHKCERLMIKRDVMSAVRDVALATSDCTIREAIGLALDLLKAGRETDFVNLVSLMPAELYSGAFKRHSPHRLVDYIKFCIVDEQRTKEIRDGVKANRKKWQQMARNAKRGRGTFERESDAAQGGPPSQRPRVESALPDLPSVSDDELSAYDASSGAQTGTPTGTPTQGRTMSPDELGLARLLEAIDAMPQTPQTGDCFLLE